MSESWKYMANLCPWRLHSYFYGVVSMDSFQPLTECGNRSVHTYFMDSFNLSLTDGHSRDRTNCNHLSFDTILIPVDVWLNCAFSDEHCQSLFWKYLSQLIRKWYLSHMRTVKAHASLHTREGRGPSLFAHTILYGTRGRFSQRDWNLALLGGCACVFEGRTTAQR